MPVCTTDPTGTDGQLKDPLPPPPPHPHSPAWHVNTSKAGQFGYRHKSGRCVYTIKDDRYIFTAISVYMKGRWVYGRRVNSSVMAPPLSPPSLPSPLPSERQPQVLRDLHRELPRCHVYALPPAPLERGQDALNRGK